MAAETLLLECTQCTLGSASRDSSSLCSLRTVRGVNAGKSRCSLPARSASKGHREVTCRAALSVSQQRQAMDSEGFGFFPLPPLDVTTEAESHASLHRLRRVRKKVDGYTQMTQQVYVSDDGEPDAADDEAPSRLVSHLCDVIAASSSSSELDVTLAGLVAPSGPLNSTLASQVLKEMSKDGKVQQSLGLLRWLSGRGYLLRRSAYTALLAALARLGPFSEAELVFNIMRTAGLEPSLHAYTALMQARSQAGRWKDVLAAMQALRAAGLKPDTMIFNCAIGACGRAGQAQRALLLWEEMKESGCPPNPGTMGLLLSTCLASSLHEKALEVYFEAAFLSLPPTRDMYKGIICMLAKLDRWPFALEIYREAMARALASPPPARKLLFSSSPLPFNALMASLSRASRWREALDIYADMQALGIRPDRYSWSALASAFGRAGEYEQVMALNKEMAERWGLRPNVEVCNATLLACQSKGKWERAVQLIWQMERAGLEPDVISFSTAIKSCEVAGQSTVALRIYRHMLRAPCNPNAFTYASLIRTLGRAKDWKGASDIFEDMQLAGQDPNIHVYNALLFAFLESRKLDDAFTLLQRMKRCRLDGNHQTKNILQRYGLDASFVSDLEDV